MRMISGCLALVLVMAATSGCLRKEVTHTIYLAPSGVVWSVIESGVRSDIEATADRQREEYGYANAANAGIHPVAEAFRRLDAQAVTTTWLRRDRPYSVMTEGTFADARQLVLAILHDVGAQGDVTLERAACQTRLNAHIDLNDGPEPAVDSPVQDLLSDLRSYRFVLSEGRFVAADGFEIREDGTIAVADPTKPAADGVLTLALAWADERCVAR